MNWFPCAYVYGLRFEGEDIFYIGSARNKSSRMKAHSSYKEGAAYPYQRYIYEGINRGKKLEMVELEVTNINEARGREAFWIWKHPGRLFNKILPAWGVITENEGEEINRLNETIAACKSRLSEIHRGAKERAREANRKLGSNQKIAERARKRAKKTNAEHSTARATLPQTPEDAA